MNYLKISIITLSLGLFACGGNKNASEQAMNELNSHLAQIEDTIKTAEGLAWAKEVWGDLDVTYGSLKEGVTALDAKVDLTELDGKWEAIAVAVSASGQDAAGESTNNETSNFDAASSTYVMEINKLLGIATYDAAFKSLTKENIAEAYEKFVTTVEMNYDKYNVDEANIISNLWDRLNDRKNELEPVKNNGKIAALKLKFAGIKTGLKARTKVLGKEGEEEKEMPEVN